MQISLWEYSLNSHTHTHVLDFHGFPYLGMRFKVDLHGFGEMSCLVYGIHESCFSFLGIGSILHIGLIVYLLVVIPGENLFPVYFVLSALWGICDAIWQTQCNCMYIILCHSTCIYIYFLKLLFFCIMVFLCRKFVSNKYTQNILDSRHNFDTIILKTINFLPKLSI